MILSVTLNPCIDHTLCVDGLKVHDTNKVVRIETDAGGKGVNLSRIVAELGGETVATGFLGGDCGHIVHRTLERQGVVSDFVDVQGETRTNFSVESGDGPPTTFNSPGAPGNLSDWKKLIAKVGVLATKADWVATGGSLPPGVPPDSYAVLGRLVRDSGANWALDADGGALKLGLAAGPDMVKPNLREGERLLGTSMKNLRQALAAVKDIHKLLKQNGSRLSLAAISLGDKGAVLATGDGAFFALPPSVGANSTIGSGDSFLGAFLLSLTKGSDHQVALRMGCAAGAATALSDGTRIGSAKDTERLQSKVVVTAEHELAPSELDGWPRP